MFAIFLCELNPSRLGSGKVWVLGNVKGDHQHTANCGVFTPLFGVAFGGDFSEQGGQLGWN